MSADRRRAVVPLARRRGVRPAALAPRSTPAAALGDAMRIGVARHTGSRRYHLGETGHSRSVARFKERFGARAVPYAEYRFERLPLTRADALARQSVKRVLRFRDA